MKPVLDFFLTLVIVFFSFVAVEAVGKLMWDAYLGDSRAQIILAIVTFLLALVVTMIVRIRWEIKS